MQRVATTVIAVVGSAARACARAAGRAGNVRVVLPAPADDSLARAIAAWEQARRAHVPFFVHDADPLADVADAWVRRFDGTGPLGELEVAVGETIARWRAGSLELPDYYLVVDAVSLEVTRRHWYLGVLRRAAPARVVPVAARPPGIRERISHLRAGPWWPPLDALVSDIERVVPDRA